MSQTNNNGNDPKQDPKPQPKEGPIKTKVDKPGLKESIKQHEKAVNNGERVNK